MLKAKVRPQGNAQMRVFRQAPRATIASALRTGLPWPGLDRDVFWWRARNCWRLFKPLAKLSLAKIFGVPHFYGTLYLRVMRNEDGSWLDYGTASLRVVTTAGVNFIVDAFQNITELEILKYHGIGTGTNAEAVGDTALQTELTTQYSPDNTRATGSLTEGASANIFRTVGTNTVDASAAVTEHGILSQAATGGGTLLDRSVFSVINLANGDSLQSTYDLTVSSGG